MSIIRFTPVTELNDPLTLAIGLSGGSSTGKTYSALLLARGIAEEMTGKPGSPIGYVDTENRRALHYKQAFPEMHHFDFQAVDETGELVGFTPERWIEVIDAAEEAKLPVIVIDSFSHSWEGTGGILDMQAQELDRLVQAAEARANGRYAVDAAKFSEQAWIDPKRRYRRLVDRIVRAKCNIIICNRAKPVRQAGFGDKAKNARATKLRRDDVPWDISGDANLIFEMTVSIVLDPAAPGCPVHQIKVADQFKGLLDPRAPMGVETGRAMAKWAKSQGSGQADKETLDTARAEARKGKAAFVAWWKANPQHRALVKTITEECERLADAADKAATQDDDNPFGEGADTTDSTPTADPAQYEALAGIIKGRLADADNPQDVLDMFDGELSGMKTHAPALFAELMAEIEGRAAA